MANYSYTPRRQVARTASPVPAGYGITAPGAPVGAPPPAPSASYRPRGGHSANFLASVAENNASDRASTAAMAAGYAPAVAQTNPDGSARMGVMRITTPDGEVHERQAQQYADAPQTRTARAVATGYGIQAGEQARGQYFADLATQRRQDADLADPAGAVARSKVDLNTATAAAVPVRTAADARAKDAQAGLYQQQGYHIEQMTPVDVSQGQAKVREADARTDLSHANTGYRIAMTPVDVARGEAQTDLAHAQGHKADVDANLAPGRVAAQNTRDTAAAAHEQALAAQPHSPPPDHAYANQRQHVGDQIARVRQQLAAAATNEAKAPLQQQLDALLYQQERLSGGHADTVVPTGYGPASPAPAPVPSGYGFASTPAPVTAPAAPQPPPVQPQPAAPAQPAAAGGIARVTTAAEWAALPSGAQFYDPAGHLRTKR